MRRWAAAVGTLLLAVAFPAVAAGGERGTDYWTSNAPADTVGGLASRWPLSRFGLDDHIARAEVTGPSVRHLSPGGVSVGDVPGQVATTITNLVWTVTYSMMRLVISAFDWAFSLDLLNAVNGRTGALAPVGAAGQSIYRDTLGPEMLTAAILLLGMWGTHRALVQRRFSQASAGVAMSVLFAVTATVIILKPAETVGWASQQTNLIAKQSLAGTGSTRVKAEDHLFKTFIYDPFTVLEFGSLDHCVTAHKDSEGFPEPTSTSDPARAVCRDNQHSQPAGGGKTVGGYTDRFLKHPPGSGERDSMYEAIRDGEENASWPTWKVDTADSPAVDIQQGHGAWMRLVMALGIFLVSLGAVLLLGGLALFALIAQIIALALLAFAPAALLAGVVPGWGHTFFRGWLGKLGIALCAKAVFALVLAILLVVSAALAAAAGFLGFMFAFGLQGALFWGAFWKRKALGNMVMSHRETNRVERSVKTAGAMAIGGAGAALGLRCKLSKDDKNEGNMDEGARQQKVPPPSKQPVPTTGLPEGEDVRTQQPTETSWPTPSKPGLPEWATLPAPSGTNGNRNGHRPEPQSFAEAHGFDAAPEKPTTDLPGKLEAARRPEPVSFAEAASFGDAPEKPASTAPRQPEKPAPVPPSFAEAEQQQPKPRADVFQPPGHVPAPTAPERRDGVFKPEHYRPAPKPVQRGPFRDPEKP